MLRSLFINIYHYSIFTNLLFTSTLQGRVYISPVIKYKFKFVQRGFNERACFEGRSPSFGRGFTMVSSGGTNIKVHELTPWYYTFLDQPTSNELTKKSPAFTEYVGFA